MTRATLLRSLGSVAGGALMLGSALGFAQSPLPNLPTVDTHHVPPPGSGMMRGDGAAPFGITRLDPARDELVAPDVKLEALADRLGLTEGPVLHVFGGEPRPQICAVNVTWGETNGRMLFITACEVVYKIRLKVAGYVPGPPAESAI